MNDNRMNILVLWTLLLIQLTVSNIVGTSINQLNGDDGSYSPTFEKKVIEENRYDGYWIEAFQLSNQSSIGLIAYGLASGDIHYYENPLINTQSVKGTLIQNLTSPVGMNQADITGNGINDIIICFQYGNTLLDSDPEGGKIVWLENPGQDIDKSLWKMHYVGRSTAMHRLEVGHFTQTKRWEIIGLPIASKPYDLLSAVPIILFRQPDNVFNVTEWPFEIINQECFHLVHDATKLNIDQLDSLLIASREGINWLYFNQNLKHWTIENIGDGEQQTPQTTYYGSGGIAIGRVSNDAFAYMPAIEPFHGHVISVYIKNMNNSLKNIQWKRYILDIYGYPNENGEGPAHHIICGDFDKDGNDEFLVALRGPSPNQGVYFYKPIDLARGLFAKWKVSDDSAARITVADFDNDNLLDFATISYNVPGYYNAENPSINIYYNRFTQEKLQAKNEIQVMKQNHDLLFKVLRPNKAVKYQALQFITIDGITFSLEILPPHSSRNVNNTTYIKVLSGTIMWTDSSTKSHHLVNHSRTFLFKPRTAVSLEIHSDNGRIITGNEGALLIVFKTRDENNNIIHRIEDIEKVIIENSLPENYPQEARELTFQFVKHDQFGSAQQFKDLEFYNMKGFAIKFADNDEQLCYMQLWAAGHGVNAGVHNHEKDFFCETHVCLINGSGRGGMHYLNSSNEDYNPLTTPDSAFEKLALLSFYEHGPLWDINAENKPVLRNDGTVVYPWHKWQAGIDRSFNQSFDVWVAFEFNSQLSTLAI